jgi:hypothetical protein
MTDTPTPDAPRKMDPLSALLAIVAVLAVVAIHVLVPIEERAQATDALVLVLGAFTVAAALRGSAIPGGSLGGLVDIVGRALGRRSSSPPSRSNRRDGSADIVVPILVSLAFTVLAVCCHGCGASAIRAQARAATIATVALEGVHRVTLAETHARLEACEDDACTVGVEADMAPIALAHDAARATLAGWVEALDVAVIAGDDGEVIAALVTAATRWLAQYSALAEALAGVGLHVPELPPFVLALAGGAS